MTEIFVLTFVGLLAYRIRRIVRQSAPGEGPKCSVCATTKRTLQWIKSWDDWYCWRCKEECIQFILNALIGDPG
jgi:hypothetical protein